jgi:hypothetical protein
LINIPVIGVFSANIIVFNTKIDRIRGFGFKKPTDEISPACGKMNFTGCDNYRHLAKKIKKNSGRRPTLPDWGGDYGAKTIKRF